MVRYFYIKYTLLNYMFCGMDQRINLYMHSCRCFCMYTCFIYLKLTLPESQALSSVVFFAECLLSGTRQRRLCRGPHSVKLGTRQSDLYRVLNTRHRTTLGKDNFAECQTLGKGGSRQTTVSGRPKADGRQSLPRVTLGKAFAECKRAFAVCLGHTAKELIPVVPPACRDLGDDAPNPVI
jgi:hypothetical protein